MKDDFGYQNINGNFAGKPLLIDFVSMANEVPKTYGTYEENLRYFQITASDVNKKLNNLIEGRL